MKRFLITTALEETWRDDQPVLFLGEWCRRFSRKDRWSRMDAEVLPYHWDDRAKLHADYRYLQGFADRLLQDLAEQLNQVHGTSHGLRYWRILLGPWLGYFVQMLFDRWESIQQAVTRHDLSGTILLAGREETLVPNDTAEFMQMLSTDEWNHGVYSAILSRFTKVGCNQRARPNAPAPKDVPVLSRKRKMQRALASWYSRMMGFLSRDDDAFLFGTYLPFRDEMRLHRRFRQAPQLWRPVPVVKVAVDWTQREWSLSGESRSDFESCARELIPQQLPTIFLEGYQRLLAQTRGLPWPRQPRLIWSSNAFIADDVFKEWAADKAEKGSPLVLGQHGGHYGTGRWSFVEDHEVGICDRYFTWGWTEQGQTKLRPIGQLKTKGPLGVRHAAQSGALLITGVLPRQSYMMYSVVVAGQWLDYFRDQCTFVDNLPLNIRKALTVRLHTNDHGWDQALRWRERFPDLRLDSGASAMESLIRRSRLYIATYNATTFLESFTIDVPTVIFWNENYWELRESAIPYFDELKRVGIFHDSPESAASHVAAIWDDMESWWNSAPVRDVVDNFKSRYSRLPANLLDKVEANLMEVTAMPRLPINEMKTRNT